MPHRPYKKLPLILLGFALAAGCLLLVFYFFFANIPESTRIDFNEIAPQIKKIPSTKPVLRVAVAAMISPKETRKYYNKLLRLIGKRLGRQTEFFQRQTYAEINDLVKDEAVDLAFVCAGPYVSGHDSFGMELLVVPIVHGRKTYSSYILVNKNSSINSFAGLRNKRFAFTDLHSNTGCLVPTYMLARMGETPESFFSDTFFTHSHDNSIKAVADNHADGAAVDSLIWEFMSRISPQNTRRTKIIAKSPAYGIPPIVVPPGLAPKLKEQLRTTLLSLHLDKEAVPLLKKLQIDRFAKGTDDMYDSVRRMAKWLRQQAGNNK